MCARVIRQSQVSKVINNNKIKKLEKLKDIRSAKESDAAFSANIWKHFFDPDRTATVHTNTLGQPWQHQTVTATDKEAQH